MDNLLAIQAAEIIKDVVTSQKEEGFTPKKNEEGREMARNACGEPYACEHPWGCFVQCGSSGIVLGSESYETAFFEAFPNDFIRGEGKTIAEAESKAWQAYQKRLACQHEYEPESENSYTGVCKKCRYREKYIMIPTSQCQYGSCQNKAGFDTFQANHYCFEHLKTRLSELISDGFDMEEGRNKETWKNIFNSCYWSIQVYEETGFIDTLGELEKYKLIEDNKVAPDYDMLHIRSLLHKAAINALKETDKSVQLSVMDAIGISRKIRTTELTHKFSVLVSLYAIGYIPKEKLYDTAEEVSKEMERIIRHYANQFKARTMVSSKSQDPDGCEAKLNGE